MDLEIENIGEATPHQTAGPFYPGEEQITRGNDLTFVKGARKRPLGDVIYVHGVVRDVRGQAIPGAKVEIWQACATGRYKSDIDTNPAPLDHGFGYWGKSQTDWRGYYRFKTVVPGVYPAEPDWDRPPHIHFRVTKENYREVITQMYFKGDRLNDIDRILQEVPAALRAGLIVDFRSNPDDPSTRVGEFDITMLD